jgi:hypothetical protein
LPKTEFEWKENDASNVSQGNWWEVEKYYPKKLIVDKDSKDQGVRLRDINGDGLVDFIYSKGIDRKTYINTGQGWLENSSYKLNEPIVNDTFEDQGVRFLDVNGDGLLDYVRGEQMYKNPNPKIEPSKPQTHNQNLTKVLNDIKAFKPLLS